MLPRDGSRRPASEWQEPQVGARRLTRIEPRRKSGAVEFHRHQHTPVEAGSAGQEALEAVDGREAGLGIVEAQKFAVHGAPQRPSGAPFSPWPGCAARLPVASATQTGELAEKAKQLEIASAVSNSLH